MTEPLIVDPERLSSASKILGAAAGNIPVGLPKLSVSGTDPLSAAIAAGAAKVEAPMAALPGIKAEATAVAQNIGVAAQRYSTTDQMLARKAQQLQFPSAVGGGNSGAQPTPPQLGKADPNVVPLDQIERQMKDLQGKIMDRAGDIAGTASDQIGKAVMKGPGEVSQGLQKWFKDPGKFGFESGFTRSNVVTASIMAVPGAIRDIADGESAGKVVVGKAAGVGAGIAAGAAFDAGLVWAAAAAGTTLGPVGTAVGLVVGLGAAAYASGAAENLAGDLWDGLSGLLS